MPKRSKKTEALENEGFDVIRLEYSCWIQGGGRSSVHGFVRRFATVRAAHEHLIEGRGRAKLESIGNAVAVVDLDYHTKGDPRKDGHVIAIATNLKDAKNFCEEFGYKEVEMTRSQFLNRVTDLASKDNESEQS